MLVHVTMAINTAKSLTVERTCRECKTFEYVYELAANWKDAVIRIFAPHEPTAKIVQLAACNVTYD